MSEAPLPFRRFSNVQWYLAHSENRVHLLCACPDHIELATFHDLVARVLRLAPQLSWSESLVHDGHLVAPLAAPEAVARYRPTPQLGLMLRELEPDLARTLADTGRPAFRASCFAAPEPDARGVRSLMVLQATHGVTEGGDISRLSRGLDAEHEARPTSRLRLRLTQRLAMWAMLPLLWAGFLFAARLRRRPLHEFRFVRVSLDRAGVAAAVRRLGVTHRAFLFGLVAHAVLHDPARKRRLNLAYSTLPRARARHHDDRFLNVRMDEFRLQTAAAPEASIRATAAAIAARGPTPIFVQAWQNAVLGWHRITRRVAPRLYQRGFFGYTPYDLVLSLVPPLMPGPGWGPLAGATFFAGSNTGTTPNCIFAVTPDRITLTLWADNAVAARVGDVVASARALGIAAEVWD
ncbi:MAG: hypothetical protein K0B00_08490 [Rhodobacteraceae bacterium]|nr:hypothetical protein [Paracoccaceae bacterium]